MADVKKIATRDSYGNTLKELAAEGHDDIVVLDADLAAATKTGMFRKAYPDRHFDCGIAEGRLFFSGKHRVPGRETNRFLLEYFLYFGRRIFRFNHQTEHIFVKPFVSHDKMPLITGSRSPTILNHPFGRFSIFIEVNRHKSHGVT